MPLLYSRDDARRLIAVTVTAPYVIEDFVAIVERQHTEGAWEYATLHDFRSVSILPTARDLNTLMQHIERVGNGRRRGAVGVAIAPDPRLLQEGLALLPLTTRIIDVELLLLPRQVEDWLGRNARTAPR